VLLNIRVSVPGSVTIPEIHFFKSDKGALATHPGQTTARFFTMHLPSGAYFPLVMKVLRLKHSCTSNGLVYFFMTSIGHLHPPSEISFNYPQNDGVLRSCINPADGKYIEVGILLK
jgi:hypothetical protein